MSCENEEFAIGGDLWQKKYTCFFCEFSTVDLLSIKDHKDTLHRDHKLYRCHICEVSTKDRESLKNHLKNIHHDQKYKCTNCSYLAKNELEFFRHSEGHRIIERCKDNTIDSTRKKEPEIKNVSLNIDKPIVLDYLHDKVCHCPKCHYKSNYRNVVRHFRNCQVEIGKKQCDVGISERKINQVNMEFTNNRINSVPKRIKNIGNDTASLLPIRGLEKERIKKDECNKRDTTAPTCPKQCIDMVHVESDEDILINQIHNVQNELESYECNLCKSDSSSDKKCVTRIECFLYWLSSFISEDEKNKENLNEMKMAKNNECKICKKYFSSEIVLQKHVEKAHALDESEICQFCDFKAPTKYLLQVHVEKEHLQLGIVMCHLCDYQTRSKGLLQHHIREVHLTDVIVIN